MPRRASIWERGNSGWFYATIAGKKVRLSQDRKEAERLFHDLHAKKGEPDPSPATGVSFRRLADEYLINTRELKNAESFAIQTRILKAFCAHAKAIRATDLKGYTLTAWFAHENAVRTKAKRKNWNTSTKAMGIKTIKAVLNWGVKQGYLTANPLKGYSAGTVARRDCIVTPEEMARIRTIVTPDFWEFLTVCWQTGARPYSEVGKLEAKHVDFAAGTATLLEHKTSRKTGRPRVLFFTPETLAILQSRAERYPTGLLFRTRRNSHWQAINCWKWFEKIERVLGIKAFPYALRHTRITRSILNGVPVEVVAELSGNNPQTIHKHYSHVGKDQAAMRAAAQKAAL